VEEESEPRGGGLGVDSKYWATFRVWASVKLVSRESDATVLRIERLNVKQLKMMTVLN